MSIVYIDVDGLVERGCEHCVHRRSSDAAFPRPGQSLAGLSPFGLLKPRSFGLWGMVCLGLSEATVWCLSFVVSSLQCANSPLDKDGQLRGARRWLRLRRSKSGLDGFRVVKSAAEQTRDRIVRPGCRDAVRVNANEIFDWPKFDVR